MINKYLIEIYNIMIEKYGPPVVHQIDNELYTVVMLRGEKENAIKPHRGYIRRKIGIKFYKYTGNIKRVL